MAPPQGGGGGGHLPQMPHAGSAIAVISHQDSHKDLSIIISEDLSWNKHYSFIISCA